MAAQETKQDRGAVMAYEVMESSDRRVKMMFSGVVEAPPDTVFPLLCPKLEEEWIEGWAPGIYDLIFSESGVNEKNCVFQEGLTRPFLFNEAGPTTWVTTAFDRDGTSLEFLLIFGGHAVLNRAVTCRKTDNGGTAVQWTDTVTFLKGPMGKEDRKVLELKLTAFSSFLGILLKHYCESGAMMPLEGLMQGRGPAAAIPEDVRGSIANLLGG